MAYKAVRLIGSLARRINDLILQADSSSKLRIIYTAGRRINEINLARRSIATTRRTNGTTCATSECGIPQRKSVKRLSKKEYFDDNSDKIKFIDENKLMIIMISHINLSLLRSSLIA